MNILVNTCLAILSVTLSLVGGEATLRFIDRTPHSANYVPLHGRNHVYYLLERPESLFSDSHKVFVIGDSFTRGENCGNELNPVARLSQRLDAGSVLAVNLGVNGTNPIDHLMLLRDSLAQLATPVAVIVVLYFNDIEISTSHCLYRRNFTSFLDRDTVEELEKICGRNSSMIKSREVERTFIREWHSWLKQFYTWKLIREVVAQFLVRHNIELGWGRASYFEKWTDDQGIHQRLMLASLKAIRQFGAESRIPVHFTIYPDVSWIAPENPQIDMYTSFITSAALEGIEIQDAWPHFLASASSDDLAWSILDEHPSCRAHSLFADFLYRRVLKADSADTQWSPAPTP